MAKDASSSSGWIVIIKSTLDEGGVGGYELTTRTVFEEPAAAAAYAEKLPSFREPLVVQGRWEELRFGKERGTLAYQRGWEPRRAAIAVGSTPTGGVQVYQSTGGSRHESAFSSATTSTCSRLRRRTTSRERTS